MIYSSKENYNIETIDESYTLEVKQQLIEITAKNSFGAARAFATLVQLVDFHPNLQEDRKAYALYHAKVSDKAAFPWRLLLIDGARHYASVRHLKHQIDALSISKMNALHFHVIDDESFPLKFSKEPQSKLVKGAYNANKYYISIKDLQEVEQYAFERGVFFYVEFEFPGHVYSWRHADPKLLCKCEKPDLSSDRVTLNPLYEGTYEYIKGALTELLKEAHFEGFKMKPIIHLGGDEVDVSCWERDPEVSQYLKDHNMTGGQMWAQLHKRVNQIFAEIGTDAIPVYWEETFNHGNEMLPGAVVQAWLKTGKDGAERLKIAQAGLKVVSSSGWYLPKMRPTGDNHNFHQDTWEDFYRIDILKDIPAELQKQVLGGGPCMWGEAAWGFLDAEDARIWPRSVAIAEVLWSNPAKRDTPRRLKERFEEFQCKLFHAGIRTGTLVEYRPCFGAPFNH